MACYYTAVHCVFCVMAFCALVATAQDECVSCSYNSAGDGTIDLQCVTDPFHHPHTRNISCDFTNNYRCVVKAVYDSSQFTRVQSLLRACMPANTLPADGCNNDYPRPSCYSVCDTHLCNQQDGRLYQGNTNDDFNGASSFERSLFLTLLLYSIGRLVV